MAVVGLSNLCRPASVYLIISLIAVIFSSLQNYGNIDIYSLGNIKYNAPTIVVFIIQILYILFWTWILNIICSAGAEYVSWLLVLLPYVLLAILLILYSTV